MAFIRNLLISAFSSIINMEFFNYCSRVLLIMPRQIDGAATTTTTTPSIDTKLVTTASVAQSVRASAF